MSEKKITIKSCRSCPLADHFDSFFKVCRLDETILINKYGDFPIKDLQEPKNESKGYLIHPACELEDSTGY